MLEHPKALETDKVKLPEIAPQRQMDNQQVTQFELGWLVAFLEGEGCVGLYWNQHRQQIAPRIQFVNTDKELVEFCAEAVDKLGVGCYIYSNPRGEWKSHWKKRYDVHIEGIKRCHTFLTGLLPYWTHQTIKRKKAELVLEFCRSRLSRPDNQYARKGGVARYTPQEFDTFQRFRKLNGKSSEAMSPPVTVVTEDMVQSVQ